MTSRLNLFLAFLVFPCLATAQTRATDAETTHINTPPLAEISRVFPSGGGKAYIDLLNGIRRGKDGSAGCIELVDRKSAEAFLAVKDREGPTTWTFYCPSLPCSGYARKKAAKTQVAVLKSLGGEVLWVGRKANFFHQPLLEQLTSALKCKARFKSDLQQARAGLAD